MSTQARRAYPPHVKALIGVVDTLLREGLRADAERSIAAYTLWVLDALNAGDLTPNEADEAFTMLDVYLTDNHVPYFSEPIQEIIFEGEILHHYNEPADSPTAARPKLMRELALQVLTQGQREAA
jgi:hypothetical protein